jgi:hypothetical protein
LLGGFGLSVTPVIVNGVPVVTVRVISTVAWIA